MHLVRCNDQLDARQAVGYISDMTKLIAYYRVSRESQRKSGLGLAAQRQAVEAYAAATGSQVVAEFTETETGKRSDRPELAAAIARARGVRGTLAVAKLDRLARSVAFTSALMEAKAPFVCCDNPAATSFTIHILAAVAEHEAKAISERTKAALAAAKRRGTKLGTHNPKNKINWRKGQRNGLAKAVETASLVRAVDREACYSRLMGDVRTWHEAGLSYAAIASKLNEAGHVTVNGKSFAAMTVHRMLNQ